MPNESEGDKDSGITEANSTVFIFSTLIQHSDTYWLSNDEGT
jgi:hypothetical protein